MSYSDMINMNVNQERLDFHEDLGSDDEASVGPRIDDETEARPPAEAQDGTQVTKWTEGDHTVDTAVQRGKSSGVVALAMLQTYVTPPTIPNAAHWRRSLETHDARCAWCVTNDRD